jgi:hypothetical protein
MVGGDIPGDQRAGGHHRARADGHARQDRDPRAQPGAVLDDDGAPITVAAALAGTADVVVDGQEQRLVPDVHAIADGHRRLQVDQHRPGDHRVVADREERAVVAPAGHHQAAHHPGARAHAEPRSAQEEGPGTGKAEVGQGAGHRLGRGLGRVERLDLLPERGQDAGAGPPGPIGQGGRGSVGGRAVRHRRQHALSDGDLPRGFAVFLPSSSLFLLAEMGLKQPGHLSGRRAARFAGSGPRLKGFRWIPML